MSLFGRKNDLSNDYLRAIRRNFIDSWSRGWGCGGTPPSGATEAIEKAASVIIKYSESGDEASGLVALKSALGDYARSINHNPLQASLGGGVLFGFFTMYGAPIPQFEWATNYINEWDMRGLYR